MPNRPKYNDVDWTKRNCEIALELGVSPYAVSQARMYRGLPKQKRGTPPKIREADIPRIRELMSAGKCKSEIAEMFGVSIKTMVRCTKGIPGCDRQSGYDARAALNPRNIARAEREERRRQIEAEIRKTVELAKKQRLVLV